MAAICALIARAVRQVLPLALEQLREKGRQFGHLREPHRRLHGNEGEIRNDDHATTTRTATSGHTAGTEDVDAAAVGAGRRDRADGAAAEGNPTTQRGPDGRFLPGNRVARTHGLTGAADPATSVAWPPPEDFLAAAIVDDGG